MPRDTTRYHRLDALAKDGGAMDQIGTRIAGLIEHVRHVAKEAHGHATAKALDDLAQALADTAADYWGDAVHAHDRDCDEEGVHPIYTTDPLLCVAFGMKQPAGEPLVMAEER